MRSSAERQRAADTTRPVALDPRMPLAIQHEVRGRDLVGAPDQARGLGVARIEVADVVAGAAQQVDERRAHVAALVGLTRPVMRSCSMLVRELERRPCAAGPSAGRCGRCSASRAIERLVEVPDPAGRADQKEDLHRLVPIPGTRPARTRPPGGRTPRVPPGAEARAFAPTRHGASFLSARAWSIATDRRTRIGHAGDAAERPPALPAHAEVPEQHGRSAARSPAE